MSRQHGMTTWQMLFMAGTAAALFACESKAPDGVVADRQHVDAMSQEHADDVGAKSPGAEIAPHRAVVSETLPYAEVDDQLVRGYFVFPADMVDPLPAIIVIHEWWGLNDGVRAMSDRLASEGYIVLAVDLYGGKVATSPSDARDLMLKVVENKEFADLNIRQAYAWLKTIAGAPRIGSLGWCFGGGWSLNTALLFPNELDAAVIYYGQVIDDEAVLEPLNVPILGLFAAEDRGITVASVNAFSATMEKLGKNVEIQMFPDVGHAFANPTGNNYNAVAAEAAWIRALSFLRLHLAIGVNE